MAAANVQFAAAAVSTGAPRMGEDARWFPTEIDPAKGVVEFVRLPAAVLREAPFLDERLRPTGERVRRPLAEVLGEDGAAAPALVFHTAFCGSTLLARALDVAGRTLVLREPGVLVRLPNLKRERHPSALDAGQWQRLVGGTLKLLGAAGVAGEQVVVKLPNVANNLISEMLLASRARRAVLLYSDLRSFLVSVLKKGELGRAFARRLALLFSLDLPQVRDTTARELLQMTDLQMAAAVWLMQMELLAQGMRAAPGRVGTLETNRFLNQPKRALTAVAAWLELGLDEAAVDAVVAGPVFKRNSKIEEQAFDVARRNEEASAIEKVYGADIDRVVEAARQGWRGLKMPALPLGNDLMSGP